MAEADALDCASDDPLIRITERPHLGHEQHHIVFLERDALEATVRRPMFAHTLLELDLPNFILTPHTAWASREAMQSLANQLVDNIEAFAAGVPQNRVA